MEALVPLEKIQKKIANQNYFLKYGKVTQVVGLIIKVEGLNVFIGEVCQIEIIKSKKK